MERKNKFLHKLVNRKEVQRAINEAKHNSSSSVLMAGFFREGELKLSTVKLAWSKHFSSWLVEFDERNSPEEMWIDYLYSYLPYPIIYWFRDSCRAVNYIKINNLN